MPITSGERRLDTAIENGVSQSEKRNRNMCILIRSDINDDIKVDYDKIGLHRANLRSHRLLCTFSFL